MQFQKNDEDRGSHTYVLYHNDKSGFYFKFSIRQKFLRETIIWGWHETVTNITEKPVAL